MPTDQNTPPDAPDTDAPDTDHSEAADPRERIAKRLARAGLCSRRDAERWIAEGRVAVNGKVLETPAVLVGPGDHITVDGEPVPDAEPTRVFRYYKPAGLVTTARDEKGRDTVFDALPDDMPRVVSVGRLDLNSEGLLLLTNDGELARHLELPATGWLRRYRVRVHGHPKPEALAKLKDGIFIDGIEYGPIEAELDRTQGANAWLTVGLREGKNREVRRVMEHLGLPVTRLIRTAYGPFQLGKLDEGGVEEVPRRVLRDFLPAFFPKLDKAEREARAEPVRMRYDRLPKAKAEAAPASATKGGRPRLSAPNAKVARETVERALSDPRSRPAKVERKGDWRDEKPRGRFPDEDQGGQRPKTRMAGPRQKAEEEGGIRVRSTRGPAKARPGFETQRAVAANVARRSGGPVAEGQAQQRPAADRPRPAGGKGPGQGRGPGGPGGRGPGGNGPGGRGPKGPGMKPGGRGADRRR